MSLNRRKPRVACVFSERSEFTDGSHFAAQYVGALLQIGGWSDVHLIGYPDASTCAARYMGKKMLVTLPNKKDAVSPNHLECRYSPWEAFSDMDCNMILVMVDSPHTVEVAKKLAKVIKRGTEICVVSLQQGTMNFPILKSALSGRASHLLNGAMGLSISRSPIDNSLRTLYGGGSILIQRLTKELEATGGKYGDLLASSGLPIMYRRNVTPWTHGAVVHNSIDAAIALSGLSARDYLCHLEGRLIWASMIRECLLALSEMASGKGDWMPSNPCGRITLRQLELFLVLPDCFFWALFRWLLPTTPGLAPCMQADLHERRKTAAVATLGRVISAGQQKKVKMPTCEAMLELLNTAVKAGTGVPSLTPAALYKAAGYPTESIVTLQKKVLWWSACSLILGIAAGLTFGGAALMYLLPVGIVFTILRYTMLASTSS